MCGDLPQRAKSERGAAAVGSRVFTAKSRWRGGRAAHSCLTKRRGNKKAEDVDADAGGKRGGGAAAVPLSVSSAASADGGNLEQMRK